MTCNRLLGCLLDEKNLKKAKMQIISYEKAFFELNFFF